MKKFIALFLLALLLVPVVLWWQLFSSEPIANNFSSNTDPQANFEQIKQSVLEQHLDNTNNLSQSSTHQITLSEQELNQLLRYLLTNTAIPALNQANISLIQDTLIVDASIDTKFPLRPFLNIKIKIDTTTGQPIFRNAAVGNIPLQQDDLVLLFNYFKQNANNGDLDLLITSQALVKRFDVDNQRLSLSYQPNNELTRTLSRSQWLSSLGEDVIASIPVYKELLYRLNENLQTTRPSLSLYMPQMFALAASRTEQGRSAISENKAALTAMALHIAPAYILEEVEKLDPLLIPSPSLQFALARRQDLGQHFLLAAVITVMTNRDIANQTGLLKELEDSKYTGFDVSDLIADRAGSLFAERLIQSEKSAREFQLRCQNIESETDFLPSLKPLTESLEYEIINPQNNPDQLYKLIGSLIDEALENRPLFRYL